MKQGLFSITQNEKIAQSIYKMRLSGDTSAIKKAGQFVNIKLDGFFLRRPISVCDYTAEELLIIYKVVGKGTEKMSAMEKGEQLDILTGLGNGYDLTVKTERPVLIGGGVGVPPLYKLAKELKKQGKRVSVILGFNSENEIFFEDEFKEIADRVLICTADGSYGIKGFVTDAVKDIDFDYFFTCGPEPMFKALESTIDKNISGQLSFEQRMGCGFGACMGCSCKTLTGNKRICREGPVLFREEIIW